MAKNKILSDENHVVGIMNKSVMKYMTIDLIVLTVIGCILEGLTSRFIGFALDAAPTVTFSLLIVFIGVVRWNLWGLLPIPFLALSMILGGHYSDLSYYAAFYSFENWQLYVSTMIGLAGLGLNVLIFRGHKTNKIIQSVGWMLLILLADYVVYCILQFVSYRLMTSGSLVHPAVIEFTYNVKNDDGELVPKVVNLAVYVEYGFIYNLFGLAVGAIGGAVLRSQGVLNNAIDKLVDDKKEREAELEYLKNIGNSSWKPEQKKASSLDESKNEKEEDSSKQ